MVIQITPSIALDEREIEFEFVRAGGPGGQNVNKVSTAVQLRFDITRSDLPADVRQRLMTIAGRRVNKEGVLVIEARRFRTQERNRRDAIERLTALIRRAAKRPPKRHPTRPTAAARRRRLAAKRRRGELKRLRRRVAPDQE